MLDFDAVAPEKGDQREDAMAGARSVRRMGQHQHAHADDSGR
jgi:hypothetical protein